MSCALKKYACLLLGFISLNALAQEPLVKTNAGYIRGAVEKGIPVFKGIPYAQPPVGDLRFTPPIDHAPWNDTLAAIAFGSQAEQPSNGKALGSENCLFLNVYTPALDKGKRPVVVWVHGGSMTNGNGSGMNGHAFADHDGIVTITINYRLGALGFLYLGDLEKRYAQSGNLGLLDVVAALKWIHENVTSFGGDPDRVTLMGESAGAKLISAVMVAPAAKGLFKQAALESGAVQCIRDKTTALKERARLLKQLGLGAGEAVRLLQMPADTLIKAQGKICDGIGGNSQFGPVYDGVTITDDAYQYTAKADWSGLNVLMGTNEDEAALFVGPNSPKDDAPQLRSAIFEPLFQNNAPYAYAFYTGLLKTDSPYAALVKTLTQYMYQLHSYRFAKALSDRSVPVWMYRYQYRKGQPFGAKHSFELHYIWDADKILSSSGDSTEKQLALNLHTSWVSFIKTGDPQVSTLPRWQRYSAKKPQVMFFDTTNSAAVLNKVYDDPKFPSAVFVLK